jgi:hypothetical protein
MCILAHHVVVDGIHLVPASLIKVSRPLGNRLVRDAGKKQSTYSKHTCIFP